MKIHEHARPSPCAAARPRTQSGFTLLELMLAVVMFATMAVVLLQQINIGYTASNNQRNRTWAYLKAQSILAEMHALVNSDEAAAIDLEVFDDGALSNPVLSIRSDGGVPIAADHPLSGNTQQGSGWRWHRKVSVRPFAGINNRNMRYVSVTITRTDAYGQQNEEASLSSVINSLSEAYPTTQVFDVYLLAIENIPGWWVYMDSIVPAVEAALDDLETRNPGLSLRSHWITRLSNGRNQRYNPYFNEALDSEDTSSGAWAYYYPATMPSGNSSTRYYVTDLVKGQMNVDGVTQNGYDATTNPQPYALADFYNHAMRLPELEAYEAARLQAIQDRQAAIDAAIAGGTVPPAPLNDMSEVPSWHALLERMNRDPDAYRNALLINLHGELLPMPPLRNYSDPAKSDVYPGLRVVTHPEELRTHQDGTVAGSDDLVLRTYAYSADPNRYYAGTSNAAKDQRVQYIIVDIMDVNLIGSVQTNLAGTATYYTFHADGKIQAMPGGAEELQTQPPSGPSKLPGLGVRDFPTIPMTNPAYPNNTHFWDDTVAPIDPSGREMRHLIWLFAEPVTGRIMTRIIYCNTPIRNLPQTDGFGTRGLYNNTRSRLYGLEYQPAPVGGTDFSRDLSALGDGPKNTARWRMTIPKEVLADPTRWYNKDGTPMGAVPGTEVEMEIRTHIYNPGAYPFGAGQSIPTHVDADNKSVTYAWWARSIDAVPFTERAQFQGDPRHNPYKDLLHGDPDFPDGYNWWFDDFDTQTTTDYPGIVNKIDRYNGQMRQDVPRLFELLRGALVNSESIYTTLTGYSYYYLGVGNEIGYDSANGYPNSIPVNLNCFGGGDTAGFCNNITGERKLIRESGVAGTYWWGMPWLGELYPDFAEATQFAVHGNLNAGSLANQFIRGNARNVYSNSTRFAAQGTEMYDAEQRCRTVGCVSFFNNGGAGNHFNHHPSGSATASVVGPGVEIQNNYGFPLEPSMSSNRPFALNTSGNDSPEIGLAPYSTNRYTATLLEEYYDAGTYIGSGLVGLRNPAGTREAKIVVSGLSPTTTLGSIYIAKYSVLAMLHSYFEMGDTGRTHRIKQPPRVEILSPTELTELGDPVTINVNWSASWTRWDGEPYTASTAVSFAENESEIEYALMVSADNGRTWYYLEDNAGTLQKSAALATPGTPPSSAAYRLADQGAGDESWVLDTPSAIYPSGTYLLRVEGYRQGQSLHYSYHIQRFYLDR